MEQNSRLSHVDERGAANMVDVGTKNISKRIAVARAEVLISANALRLITENNIKKGDVFGTARIAGIMGAKKTPELIPLCHSLALEKVAVEIRVDELENKIIIEAVANCSGKTGVEMEALTAVTIAALTIYDMIKAVDRAAVINNIRLVRKSGGKSGDYNRSN
ncbi:MAG: cyclic pyranopterin monophosphate synthase MoaC [Negativicutes bacterium]